MLTLRTITMPRRGKTTVKGTTVNDLYTKLVEKYIELKKQEFKLRQIRLSRAKVYELSLLKFLEIQGILEPFLKELDYSDSAIRNIKDNLKLVR